MIQQPSTSTLFPYTTLFRSLGRQAQLHAGLGDAVLEPAQRLAELLLARDDAGEVELPADACVAFEQHRIVAALRGDGGAGEARRAGAGHGNALARRGGEVIEFGLGAGARVDRAARGP